MKACPNCKEKKQKCACLRNKCIKCGGPVGNITFTVCDDCWDKESLAAKPTEPGWYWWRSNPEDAFRPVNVYLSEGKLNIFARSLRKSDEWGESVVPNGFVAELRALIKGLRHDSKGKYRKGISTIVAFSLCATAIERTIEKYAGEEK